MKATIAGLRQLGLDEAAVRAIEGENAAALFPRLGAAIDPVTFAVRYLLTEAATGRMRMLDILICNRELPPNKRTALDPGPVAVPNKREKPRSGRGP